MKRKVSRILLLQLMTAAVLLSACQKSEPESKAQMISETEVSAETSSDSSIYVYEKEETNEEYNYDLDDWYEYSIRYRYELNLSSTSEAELIITTYYNDQPDYITSHYTGTCERKDNNLVFTPSGLSDIYFFTLENDKIVSDDIVYASGIEEDLSGTYTGSSEEYGDFTLLIDEYYRAKLVTSNAAFSGRIYMYADRYDLSVSNENDVIDWYVSFNDGIVTYVPFGVNYESCEGDYTIYGSLGTYTLSVDKDGSCNTEMVIDGNYQYLSGYVSDFMEGSPFASVYLENDNYTLYLDLMDITGDGTLNYSGRLTVNLSAG